MNLYLDHLVVLGILLLRIFVPLLILKRPLLGGVLAVALDYFDFTILWGMNSRFLENYQQIDKLLDIHYLSLEALVILNWKNKILKRVLLGLFGYRLVGVFLFELTKYDYLLFYFPNLFENLFLLIITYRFLKANFKAKVFQNPLLMRISIILAVVFKIYQELSLHIIKTSPWIGASILGLK